MHIWRLLFSNVLKSLRQWPIQYFLGFSLCFISISSVGDDIDLFRLSGNASTGHNILFVLDTSASMNFTMSSSGQGPKRIEVLKQSLNNIIDDIFDSGVNLNIALSAFPSSQNGMYVISGFQNTGRETQDASVRDEIRKELKESVNNLTPSGGTPINESLWGARNYFYGEKPRFSNISENNSNSMRDEKYSSPFQTSCQTNHIILFSDGAPNDTSDADELIQKLTLPSGSTFQLPEGKTACGGQVEGSCGAKISDWFSFKDHSASIEGIQNIQVHTIGLTDKSGFLDYLVDIATTPNNAYEAANANELSAQITNILNSTISSIAPIAAPAVSVNVFNSLENRDQIFYSLFEPNGSSRWRGNIKRYRMNNDGEIVDVKNQLAFDKAVGGFRENARSWWTGDLNGDGVVDNDGNQVSIGGFASAKWVGKAGLQFPDQRKLYTWWGEIPALSSPLNSFPLDNNNDGLQNSDFIQGTEDKFRQAMSNTDGYDDSKFYEAMHWLRGGDNDEPNGWMGDVIHSSPVLVNYFSDSEGFDDTLFVGSNLGFLHAINPEDGEELFAYMPKELLANGYEYFSNRFGSKDKIYGLDSPLSIWRNDVNRDGSILTEKNTNQTQEDEFIYLYQAMRRGGKNIYALDISYRNNPSILWQITGGEGNFSSMGQSWSVPKHQKISWCVNQENCNVRDVLVFGGGYDPAYDESLDGNTGTTDQGNAIYMVDAKTGDKLWSLGHTSAEDEHTIISDKMLYSMVADVTPVDANNDGIMDVLIAIDIQGQIWRIDFNHRYDVRENMASAGVIAQLSSNRAISNKRRYYNQPDVAFYMKRGVDNSYMAISVASGYRTKLKDRTVQDRISVVIDRSPFNAPESYGYTENDSPVTFNHLIDISTLSDLSQDSPISVANLLGQNNTHGVYLDLRNQGEKVLSSTTTFGGELFVSSFTPFDGDVTGESACNMQWGSNKMYRVNLNPLVGRVSLDSLQYSPISEADLVKEIELSHRGLPPQPQIILRPCTNNCPAGEEGKTKPTLCVGLECGVQDLLKKPTWYRSYWREAYARQ